MTAESIKEARRLASEFAQSSTWVLETCARQLPGSKVQILDTGKATASLRRKSMDLTRALAEMRRPT